MFTFTILLFPAAISAYLISKKTKESSLLVITGLIIGILTVGIRAFFTFSHRIIPLSLSGNFLYFLLREELLPTVIIYGLFFFISTDVHEYKVTAFFPLISSFYAVFLPYTIISGEESKAIFSIFIKPVLFLVMVITIAIGIKEIYNGVLKNKIHCISGALIVLVYMTLPAFINSLWIINGSRILWISVTVIYILISMIPLLLKKTVNKIDE